MPLDYDVTARVRAIADVLETAAGAANLELANDQDLITQLKRIEDAISVSGVLEAHALGAHTDVTLTTEVPRDLLVKGPTDWINDTLVLADLPALDLSDLGAKDLPDLDDVLDATVPTSGHMLRGNGSAWTNAALVLGDLPAIALNDLSDTSVAAPATNAQIFFDGANWIDGEIKPHWLNAALDGTVPVGSRTFLMNTRVATGDTYKWTEELFNLSVLKDVEDALSPIADDLLSFDGAEWTNVAHTHNTMSDTTITAVGSGDFLRYDGAGWVNTALILADLPAIGLDDLSDVIITAAASGEYIRHNGSNWVDATIQLGDLPAIGLDDLSDATITSATDLDLLQYDNGTSQWVNRTVAAVLDGDFVRRDGTTELTADWDAGAYEITANKFIAQDTTVTSYDTADFGCDITIPAFDFVGNKHRGLVVDQDFDNNGQITNASLFGIEIEQLHIGSTAQYFGNVNAIRAVTAMRGETIGTPQAGDICGNFLLKTNNSAAVWAVHSQSINDGTGIAFGYKGSGNNTSAGTGHNSTGVYGFADSSSGIRVGLQAAVGAGTATFGFGLYGTGHNHYTGGVTYFYANTAIATAATKTHITPGTDDGSVYIEDKLEVDGIAYFDGDIDHNGTNWGMFGTAPVAQQTVTGSRGGNAALADLLTKLANYGVIVDSTTA